MSLNNIRWMKVFVRQDVPFIAIAYHGFEALGYGYGLMGVEVNDGVGGQEKRLLFEKDLCLILHIFLQVVKFPYHTSPIFLPYLTLIASVAYRRRSQSPTTRERHKLIERLWLLDKLGAGK